MDRHPLDAVAKTLASGITRRQVARGLAGAVALFLARGRPGAAAYNPDAEACAFLDLINAYRTQNGLGPLTLSPTLGAAAEIHAQDMAAHDYLSHTLSDGTSAHQNMINAGYPSDAWWGENIYAGYGVGADGVDNASAAGAFAWWRNSPHHNANMLSGNFAAIGIARAYNATSTYQWYWTTDFGGVVDGVVSCGAGAGAGGGGSCVGAAQACDPSADACCGTGYGCADNFCGAPGGTACCGQNGAPCASDCDCCGAASFCDASGQCANVT